MRRLAISAVAVALCFAAQPAHAQYDGNGFTLDEAHAILPAYTVRLVLSPGIDLVRPEVERAAAEVVDITGISVTVDPNYVLVDRTAGDGEILVRVTEQLSGCPLVHGTSTSLMCTSPHRGYGGPRAGVYYQMGADIQITPQSMTVYSYRFRHDVLHEMGHAFGLGHYNAVFEGEIQVMHYTDYPHDTFQSGDINGLLFERDYGA